MMNTIKPEHIPSSTHTSLYTLEQPSPTPSLPRRYLEDWANMPYPRSRGLRRDLHKLLSSITPYYADICTALLWAGMIPTLVIVGTLAGY